MAQLSPLDTYKKVLKDFDVTEDQDVLPVQKATYLQSQIAEQKAILNRLFFDITIAKIKQEEAKDSTTADAHRKKVDDFAADVRQIKAGLEVNLKLLSALREEYAELNVAE